MPPSQLRVRRQAGPAPNGAPLAFATTPSVSPARFKQRSGTATQVHPMVSAGPTAFEDDQLLKAVAGFDVARERRQVAEAAEADIAAPSASRLPQDGAPSLLWTRLLSPTRRERLVDSLDTTAARATAGTSSASHRASQSLRLSVPTAAALVAPSTTAGRSAAALVPVSQTACAATGGSGFARRLIALIAITRDVCRASGALPLQHRDFLPHPGNGGIIDATAAAHRGNAALPASPTRKKGVSTSGHVVDQDKQEDSAALKLARHLHERILGRWWEACVAFDESAAEGMMRVQVMQPEGVSGPTLSREAYVGVMARIAELCVLLEAPLVANAIASRSHHVPNAASIVASDFAADTGSRLPDRGITRHAFTQGTLRAVAQAWAPAGTASELETLEHEHTFLSALLPLVFDMPGDEEVEHRAGHALAPRGEAQATEKTVAGSPEEVPIRPHGESPLPQPSYLQQRLVADGRARPPHDHPAVRLLYTDGREGRRAPTPAAHRRTAFPAASKSPRARRGSLGGTLTTLGSTIPSVTIVSHRPPTQEGATPTADPIVEESPPLPLDPPRVPSARLPRHMQRLAVRSTQALHAMTSGVGGGDGGNGSRPGSAPYGVGCAPLRVSVGAFPSSSSTADLTLTPEPMGVDHSQNTAAISGPHQQPAPDDASGVALLERGPRPCAHAGRLFWQAQADHATTALSGEGPATDTPAALATRSTVLQGTSAVISSQPAGRRGGLEHHQPRSSRASHQLLPTSSLAPPSAAAALSDEALDGFFALLDVAARTAVCSLSLQVRIFVPDAPAGGGGSADVTQGRAMALAGVRGHASVVRVGYGTFAVGLSLDTEAVWELVPHELLSRVRGIDRASMRRGAGPEIPLFLAPIEGDPVSGMAALQSQLDTEELRRCIAALCEEERRVLSRTFYARAGGPPPAVSSSGQSKETGARMGSHGHPPHRGAVHQRSSPVQRRQDGLLPLEDPTTAAARPRISRRGRDGTLHLSVYLRV